MSNLAPAPGESVVCDLWATATLAPCSQQTVALHFGGHADHETRQAAHSIAEGGHGRARCLCAVGFLRWLLCGLGVSRAALL